MNAMTRSLAAEFGPSGIACNAVMRGGFLTQANENLKTPEMQQMFRTGCRSVMRKIRRA
ncbi:MAG: SDR family oxidoreductase [Novosphingobium sp.]|nr:SDR family oxidoreductase [Novosphingobium sp.]MCB2079917.1 SDR family oxidoreductase [Novosphingobium sp.]